MKKAWSVIWRIILWTVFAGCIFVLLAMYTGLNDLIVRPLVTNETPQKSDVIIVLGGGLIRSTRSLPWSVEERMRQAVDLYKNGFSSEMIVTGGLAWHGGITESEVMAPYAVNLGVPAAQVLQEDKAKDTFTNAKYSKQIMDQYGWRNAMVVTSAFHSGRACKVFHKQNINVICVAASKNPTFNGNAFRNLLDLRAIIREYLATVYYWLGGRI